MPETLTVQDAPSEAARLAMVKRWKRRSRVVGFWRKVLPFAIFIIILALAGWITAHALLDRIQPAVVETTNPRMVNPRLYGRDNNDRYYLLAAKEAVRDAKEQGRLTLSNPTFNLGAGRVQAKEGIYVEGSTDIILRGDVVVVSADGARMQTQEALIDTRTGTVTNTRAPNSGRVQIDNDMGSISAEDYTIAKNGAVTFHGRVHGVINQR